MKANDVAIAFQTAFICGTYALTNSSSLIEPVESIRFNLPRPFDGACAHHDPNN